MVLTGNNLVKIMRINRLFPRINFASVQITFNPKINQSTYRKLQLILYIIIILFIFLHMVSGES